MQPQTVPQSQEPEESPEDYGEEGSYEEQDIELLKLQLDVSIELKKFEREVLRGQMEVLNKKGEKVWIAIASSYKPPMNELGVRELLARIKGRATTIAKLSYKTDNEIFRDMFYFDMSLSELIAKRSDKWDMDMEIAKSIKDAAIELVWDIVASSRNGFTAINLRSQYQRQDISRSDIHTKEGRSFLGIPLGRKG